MVCTQSQLLAKHTNQEWSKDGCGWNRRHLHQTERDRGGACKLEAECRNNSNVGSPQPSECLFKLARLVHRQHSKCYLALCEVCRRQRINVSDAVAVGIHLVVLFACVLH